MVAKKGPGAPQERFLMRSCFWRPFRSLLASIFWGSGLDFRWFLDDFWNFLAYFGHVFGCSFLSWFSLFLVRSSTTLAKKIQELAEHKAENPRTCRGQSREENPYERLQENSNPSKLCSSKLLSLSQPSLLQKPWAAVLPPGGLQLIVLGGTIQKPLLAVVTT